MDMNINEIIEVLKHDVEAAYKHCMGEKKAIEMLKEYQHLKEKLSELVKDIETLASNNNKELASIRHKIMCNGVLDNGLSDAEESFEAGYSSATGYILYKLKNIDEYEIVEKYDDLEDKD